MMRMKAEFSWIIFILLIEHANSRQRCERGTLLGNLSYGKILPRSAFTTKFQVSLYQCATECWLRKQRCKSFNYRIIYPSCQLCEEDSGPGGINLQPEHDSIHSNIDTWKNIHMGNCSALNCTLTQRCDPFNPSGSTCVPSECPLLAIRPNVTIDPSNETSVGTHVWQRCVLSSMERVYHIATCLESTAQWSTANALCDMEYKNDLIEGFNFSIKFHDVQTTFDEAKKICQSENARLLSFTTEDQINKIRLFLDQKKVCVFAGITDEAQEGNWTTWDGKVVSLHWNSGEGGPNKYENCGFVHFNYSNNGLADISCNTKCSFICSKN